MENKRRTLIVTFFHYKNLGRQGNYSRGALTRVTLCPVNTSKDD